MDDNESDRSAWLARHIMPAEAALRRWIQGYASPSLDVDDIIQETYARLAGLPSVAEIENPRGYAFQTAYSIVLAHRRRSRIIPIMSVPDIDSIAMIAQEPSPEVQVSDREELRNVSRAVAALPSRVRQIFLLRRVHGLSQREVAQRLGTSENIVAKAMMNGLQAVLTSLRLIEKSGSKTPFDTLSIAERAKRHISPKNTGKKSPK